MEGGREGLTPEDPAWNGVSRLFLANLPPRRGARPKDLRHPRWYDEDQGRGCFHQVETPPLFRALGSEIVTLLDTFNMQKDGIKACWMVSKLGPPRRVTREDFLSFLSTLDAPAACLV